MFIVADWEAEESPYANFVNANDFEDSCPSDGWVKFSAKCVHGPYKGKWVTTWDDNDGIKWLALTTLEPYWVASMRG